MFPAPDSGHPLNRLLHRRIFWTTTRDHFTAQYKDDVDPEGFCDDTALGYEEHGLVDCSIKVWIMPSGICAARAVGVEGEQWAAFETLERAGARKLHAAWAVFARGFWTLNCPKEPGVYPACAKSLAISPLTPFTVPIEWQLRRLQRIEGAVRDVTEFTPSTHRTLWRGYWWSEALPQMPAPTIEV